MSGAGYGDPSKMAAARELAAMFGSSGSKSKHNRQRDSVRPDYDNNRGFRDRNQTLVAPPPLRQERYRRHPAPNVPLRSGIPKPSQRNYTAMNSHFGQGDPANSLIGNKGVDFLNRHNKPVTEATVPVTASTTNQTLPAETQDESTQPVMQDFVNMFFTEMTSEKVAVPQNQNDWGSADVKSVNPSSMVLSSQPSGPQQGPGKLNTTPSTVQESISHAQQVAKLVSKISRLGIKDKPTPDRACVKPSNDNPEKNPHPAGNEILTSLNGFPSEVQSSNGRILRAEAPAFASLASHSSTAEAGVALSDGHTLTRSDVSASNAESPSNFPRSSFLKASTSESMTPRARISASGSAASPLRGDASPWVDTAKTTSIAGTPSVTTASAPRKQTKGLGNSLWAR